METNSTLVVAKLKEITGYPVFKTDITRDEVLSQPSFFVYEDKGDIRQGTNGNQYLVGFVISFITTDDATIDEIDIIQQLRPFGLLFDRTETDSGRIADSENEAKMTTFYFNVPMIHCGWL